MKAQPVFTPEIANCAICNAPARCIDWDFNERYIVMCDNNHMGRGECNTPHRAICRWNNLQLVRKE